MFQAKTKPESNWPQFRGPRASGIAEGFRTPTEWDVEQKKNLKFKTPIPGLGHSSPIVWGEFVFVATALSAKNNDLKVGLYGDITPVSDDATHSWRIYCLNKKSGKVLWSKVAYSGVPKVKRHPKATQANTTLTTNGTHLVAFFGSEGLFCFDLSGKLLWQRDFGVLDSGYYVVPDAQWGFASSPIIVGDRVIVQCDVQKDSFVAALDLRTGKDVWKTPRTEVPTWGTPSVCRAGGRTQIVVNGYKHIGGYDFATGKELWKLKGGGDIPVPTPVVAGDLIYVTNAHGRMAPIYAIKATATGDITLPDGVAQSEHIAWSTPRDGAYMQTPLVYKNYLYVCRDNGVLYCYDAKTGKQIYSNRLGSGRTGFTASAVAADGKLYFTSEEGNIFVIQAGPKFIILSGNEMGEVCMATPAISEGVIYFHTQGHLVAIAEKK